MTPLEVLVCAQELLSKPERWVQGSMAQDKHGRGVNFADPAACRFSLEGALFRVCYISRSRLAEPHQAVKRAIHRGLWVEIASFNDAKGTTWTAVQQKLNEAIQSLGGSARDFTPKPEEE